MTSILQIFILIPVIGFILSLLIPAKKEGIISRVAFLTVGLHLISFIVFSVFWLFHGHETLNLKEIVLFKSKDYEFLIDFCFDEITVVYLLVGAFLTFLVTIYSRYYLHREEGYKRFFNTILFFYVGYNVAILSGNFETLFIGWEILGISSFLLIAFYRNRYLPVKNAIKVFSVYRIGDIGLILAMWASHHLWHENITFLKLSNYELVHEHILSHSFTGVFISLMILVAAAVKSAQLPFSSWLPRAMEGPTPSSAIFYGSLSVHLGVFLLLRTFPFWEHQISVRILIALLGLTTSIIASLIARVQSSVKSQIAYASIAQIGLIFIEVAAGFESLALFHFAGNAFLRTYQLLVSPSVVSYMIREQFYNFIPRQHTIEDSFPKKVEYSIYVMSLKEWNLDLFMDYIVWKPLKNVGRKLDFLTINKLMLLFIPTYVVGLVLLYNQEKLAPQLHEYLPGLFSLIGFIMVLKSFSERKSPRMSWLLIIMNHFWIALAISFNEHFKLEEAIFYLSGIIIMGAFGYFTLSKLKSIEKTLDLNRFYGHVYEHPKFAMMFLLACLGLTGFPITSTFIGEDLIFSHIHEDQIFLAFFISSSFIIGGISVIRVYARIFLGPHIKTYHEVPYKSS
ncbi:MULTISPECIES: proton-conducting transporter membrane subunit [unclassified Arcicella]|uniref:proton-conducting transporter transmembrane domain-containing protein n=1 Tax=unclassified Arcicella TaxID=2644986 RepID=UPI00285B2F7C|nr:MULTISPECIES: proton-conducting transporter membrane subunit [unclassified Arcicella]MDR6562545.1 NADH:ubiquinone oxidoreductase subunit 5 (subunit L)/multisubunit Na+/H+ antiporter MnhA subunit [Arcicella sp. BE51]MDR6812632.1 NADH:ubiquinone oxidoreductase subunit 5 (subunit L)/multisubunit Na+/H+ antiporter MnhA subunit [Arcicella sp. BE140]MDR6823944.1 NADH:ubiquinone oxidoreductase subunit 5 (subunit L)/multisubunit Na+/H+ antiporter MnhA subunit [Arcicella sp. BE139]